MNELCKKCEYVTKLNASIPQDFLEYPQLRFSRLIDLGCQPIDIILEELQHNLYRVENSDELHFVRYPDYKEAYLEALNSIYQYTAHVAFLFAEKTKGEV